MLISSYHGLLGSFQIGIIIFFKKSCSEYSYIRLCVDTRCPLSVGPMLSVFFICIGNCQTAPDPPAVGERPVRCGSRLSLNGVNESGESSQLSKALAPWLALESWNPALPAFAVPGELSATSCCWLC